MNLDYLRPLQTKAKSIAVEIGRMIHDKGLSPPQIADLAQSLYRDAQAVSNDLLSLWAEMKKEDKK